MWSILCGNAAEGTVRAVAGRGAKHVVHTARERRGGHGEGCGRQGGQLDGWEGA